MMTGLFLFLLGLIVGAAVYSVVETAALVDANKHLRKALEITLERLNRLSTRIDELDHLNALLARVNEFKKRAR